MVPPFPIRCIHNGSTSRQNGVKRVYARPMIEQATLRQAPERHAYVCNVCGSDHVTRDAWATWDVDAQDWILEVAFDHAHCHRCMGVARLDRVLLTSPVTFRAPDINLCAASG